MKLKEIGSQNFAPAGQDLGNDAAAKQHEQHRHLGGRIGVTKASHHGAAISNGNMGDMFHNLGDQWIGMPYGLVELELAMARHRLDDDQTILDADTLEPHHMLNVDEQGRRSETEVHGRKQALAAGKNDRIVVARKRPDRLVKRSRRSIDKERRLHDAIARAGARLFHSARRSAESTTKPTCSEIIASAAASNESSVPRTRSRATMTR